MIAAAWMTRGVAYLVSRVGLIAAARASAYEWDALRVAEVQRTIIRHIHKLSDPIVEYAWRPNGRRSLVRGTTNDAPA